MARNISETIEIRQIIPANPGWKAVYYQEAKGDHPEEVWEELIACWALCDDVEISYDHGAEIKREISRTGMVYGLVSRSPYAGLEPAEYDMNNFCLYVGPGEEQPSIEQLREM